MTTSRSGFYSFQGMRGFGKAAETAPRFLQCPKECPIYADDRADGVDCNFECVEATPKVANSQFASCLRP